MLINDTARLNRLPQWIRDAIDASSVSDRVLNRRNVPRQCAYLVCEMRIVDDSKATPQSVKVINVSSGGIGFIARRDLRVRTLVRITPDPTCIPDGTPVVGRVMHCTKGAEGFKVGCKFVESDDST